MTTTGALINGQLLDTSIAAPNRKAP